MNEDEVERLRDAIAHSQTRCRCGHLLAACADCRDWLSEHSLRIAAGWHWYVNHPRHVPAGQLGADAAELNNLGVYLSRRFLNG